MHLFEIIEQLESCNYECEASMLKNNVAFIALKKLAELQPFNLCDKVEFEISGEIEGVPVSVTKQAHIVRMGMKVLSCEAKTVYGLTENLNSPSSFSNDPRWTRSDVRKVWESE